MDQFTAFGSYLKRLRIAREITLREFCETNKFDPGNYSRLERGLNAPPQREDLIERYATALGLQRGSDEWIELFDMAAASRGQIPKDLMEDGDLVGKLPALFRTLRGTPVDGDKLDALVEEIRKN